MGLEQRNNIVLELKNITKSFGSNHVHRGLNLNLQHGESLALLGGSGTGKSLLLRSIIGLEFIDRGEILFKGQRIDQLKEEQYAPFRIQISYSFQSGALFDSLNVFDNIAYPLFEHTNLTLNQVEDKVKTVLELIDLSGKEELMPSDLSGGMQKRVGMARAMIMNPEVILYDEPTAGLDPANTQNVVKILKELKGMGHASIFVTHDIASAVELCDRIAVLHDGSIAFSGTPREFKNSEDPRVTRFSR